MKFPLIPFLAISPAFAKNTGRRLGKNTYECPDIRFTADAPDLDTLDEWTPKDYSETNGILPAADSADSGNSFFDRKYMYNSEMVLPPDGDTKKLFKPTYKLTNAGTEFPRDGSSPGVPGAYDYTQGYEHWGGDDVLLGKQRYTSMIAHFGHSHILTVLAKINVLRRNPCEETPSQDDMLAHLLDGSKQIFAWFAGLVDSDGNPAGNPDNNAMIGQIQGLMSMLIYGDGTTDGVVDLNNLFTSVGGFIAMACNPEAPSPNCATLQAVAGRVQEFLGDVLDLDGVNPIPLKAWKQLMDEHQSNTVNNFLRYREVWRTKESNSDYNELKERATEEHIALVNSGPQMGAFFGLFYLLTNFLDKLFPVPADEDSEYAIPFSIMEENIDEVLSILKWNWNEHSVMFNDYAKAAALDDEDALFNIQINLLDSCTVLATAIGEVFARFDRLVRFRDVYGLIGGMTAA